jgi:hypothetical protein
MTPATSTYALPHMSARKNVVFMLGAPTNGRSTQAVWIEPKT